jgi:hypothetical protein
MKATLGTAKASTIPDILGMCSTDARFTQVLNEAHKRLVDEGKWWGTFQRYDICVGTDGCLVWPRQVATIETFAINDVPQRIRNGWYEFLETGYGVRSNCADSCETQMIDRGTACVFQDMPDSTRYVQVYSEIAEAATATIIVQGYDENGNWIRTLDGAVWIDGEKLVVSTTVATSTNIFSAVTGIIKTVTNGPVHLSYYLTPGPAIPIGYYEATETLPSYRKTLIPGLANVANYTCPEDPTSIIEKRIIQTVVKLDHIDVVADNDFLVLGNIPALKMACKAVQFENQENQEKAVGYWAQARDLLEKELRHYQGEGVIEPARIEFSGSPGEVESLI